MHLFDWLTRLTRPAPRTAAGRACARHRLGAAVERLEDRTVPATYRPIDGAGTNPAHPAWGATGADLLRLSPPAYGDGISTPAGANRPSARAISNAVADQGDAETLSARDLSAMIYAWGQ